MKLQALFTVCLYSAIQFGQFGYAITPDEGFKALGDWWKKTLEPAAGEVFKTASDFGGQHLGAAVAEADKFGKNTLAPALEKGIKAIENYGQEFFEAIADEGDDGVGKPVLDVILEKAQKLPEEALKHAKGHPVKTAWMAANALTFFAPGIIAGPVLWAAGWGSAGVRAGEFSLSERSLYTFMLRHAFLPSLLNLVSISEFILIHVTRKYSSDDSIGSRESRRKKHHCVSDKLADGWVWGCGCAWVDQVWVCYWRCSWNVQWC